MLDLVFQGELRLAPGRHRIEVVRDRAKILGRLGIASVPEDRPFPQFGRFEPRIIEVDASGTSFEIDDRGRRAIEDGVLRLSIPMSAEEAEQLGDWNAT
ncbi:MAG: hypothetical protein HC923_10490 [Myxococcales bacterium]|nr:hypothetical protein [Myxococcales bacterium]